MAELDSNTTLDFIKEDFILYTNNIQKSENKLHLILALSLTVGAAGFGFIGEQSVSEQVLKSPENMETLQIGFFVLAIIQWLIALSYIGYFYNYFVQLRYIKFLANGLRRKISDQELKRYFLRGDSFTKKINLSFPNVIIIIFGWGVPMIVPSLLGLFALITGYKYADISYKNFNSWFMYHTANFFGILLALVSVIIIVQVIRRKLF